MKKILLLLLCVPLIGFGQEKTSAFISVDKLYIGLENPITISSPGKKNKNLTVSFKDGVTKCTDKGEGKYILMPSGKYNKRVSEVSIYEGDKKLSTIEVKLFQIPPPLIQIFGISNSQQEVTVSEILSAGVLTSKLPMHMNTFKGYIVQVAYFDLKVLSSQDGTMLIKEKIKRIDAAKDNIQQANTGDIVVIDNIYIKINGKISKYGGSIGKKIK